MPEIPVPQDRKRSVAFIFEGETFTANYYTGTHSKKQVESLEQFLIQDANLFDPAQRDHVINALVGFKMEWDATYQGLPIPTDAETLEGIDGIFLYTVLSEIVGDMLPKENDGDNSQPISPVEGKGSAPRPRQRRRKQE